MVAILCYYARVVTEYWMLNWLVSLASGHEKKKETPLFGIKSEVVTSFDVLKSSKHILTINKVFGKSSKLHKADIRSKMCNS